MLVPLLFAGLLGATQVVALHPHFQWGFRRDTPSSTMLMSSRPEPASTRSTTTTNRAFHSLQKRAAEIAVSFQHSDPFQPFLIREGHSQTILGHFMRSIPSAAYLPADRAGFQLFFEALPTFLFSLITKASLSGDPVNFWDERERVPTPDGDFFHADYKYCSSADEKSKSDAPVVVLCHGLASSSEANLSKDLARAFTGQGYHCICLNFRGCSGVPNETLGAYHLGFTDDLKHFLNLLSTRMPSSRVYLSGFSLGANVVLKCLGELQEDALYQYNVHGAVALCAPLDQTKNAYELMKEGINRRVYTGNLLKALKGMAKEKFERFCDGDKDTDQFNYKEAMDADFISEFDNGFIAPIYGFESCWDYYRKTSSIYFLENITVPTLILNAEDDPFFDSSVWPTEKSFEYNGQAPIKMIREKHGGHLGFCFHVVEPNNPVLKKHDPPTWVATQAARFLTHVDAHPDLRSLKRSIDEE